MVRCSNGIIGLVNILTLCISIPIIAISLYLGIRADNECKKFLEFPALAFGIFLLVVSLIGLIGSCCRVTFFLWIYLFVMFLLIIILFCFTGFAFVVTNKGVGQAISGRGYQEYRLGDYSDWLQQQVGKPKIWTKIKSCLNEAQVCKSLGNDVYKKASQFYKSNLSPTQSGCCKPPTSCGYEFKNATFWTTPKSGLVSADEDCMTWSNIQDNLCYDCKSCKASVLANLKNEWKNIALVNVVLLIALVVIYSFGCCAFRNNRNDNQYKRYRGAYP